MKEFIDKTETQEGTPINRANLMAMQGFTTQTIRFNEDGSISELNIFGELKTTTFNDDGSITERIIGEKVMTKTTQFASNEVRVVLS